MSNMCSAPHCSGVSDSINKICKANGWPVNHLVLVCDPTTGTCCDCTCSCLAYNTPVAVTATTTAAIQSFELNDPVLARDNGVWVEKEVKFSDGTAPDTMQPEMCHITYKEDEELKIIVVTLDHTFLTADNKLIRARQLKKSDSIQAADGSMTEILEYNIKSYIGGVWNIATSHDMPSSLEGHLLNTQGLISGDYAVQLFYNELIKQGLSVSATEKPEFNSHQYQESLSEDTAQLACQAASPTMDVSHFLSALCSSSNAGRKATPAGGVFLHLDHTHVLSMPKDIEPQGYFTLKQADAIRRNDTVVDKNVMTRTDWLLTIFHGFYPHISMIVDYPSRQANAFAFYLDNRPVVLLQGGLLHAKQLDWEGVALIVAYCVARFDDNTLGADGMNCKPQADEDVPGVLTNVFYPLYPNTIFPGLKQIEALFNTIPDKLDNPIVGCHETALGCRIKTYQNSMQYLPLPVCAGGDPDFLSVTGAQSDSTTQATIDFDAPLNPEEAVVIGNYQLDPVLAISNVELVGPEENQVVLTADYKEGAKYKVTVENVRSVTGLTLDPAANSAEFTVC